jgi:hypothetical protein
MRRGGAGRSVTVPASRGEGAEGNRRGGRLAGGIGAHSSAFVRSRAHTWVRTLGGRFHTRKRQWVRLQCVQLHQIIGVIRTGVCHWERMVKRSGIIGRTAAAIAASCIRSRVAERTDKFRRRCAASEFRCALTEIVGQLSSRIGRKSRRGVTNRRGAMGEAWRGWKII